MIREQVVSNTISSPGSPPGMTTSKSSKSSSFQSLNSDDGSVLSDVSHFEDIGLDDDSATVKVDVRPGPTPLVTPVGRNLASVKRPPVPEPRRSFPNLQTNVYAANPRSTNVSGLTDPRSLSLSRGHSTTSLPAARRNRSVSPNLSLDPRDIDLSSKPQPRARRGSRLVTRRRSLQELERECDEDDGDDIPDGIVLENVPISPRPVHERPPSRAPSVSPSPDRAPKERVRNVGNGTPAVAQAQGCLRSPSWKSDVSDRPPSSPLNLRANSWNLALADLNAESKALTEKLEEHADELQARFSHRPSGSARPNTWNSGHMPYDHVYDKRARVKSSTPELPPLRRTNIMVDPLPISKEKEAVLSRTRPSWLPPKDPAEERRHLKEYQKMMAASAKAEERREAARRTRAESRDHTADDLMHIWEDDIIPRWNDAIRERRTRDMWWRGVAPRSRGVVWARAIGNELGLTGTTFRAALTRAHDLEERVRSDRADAEDARRVKWFEQIRRDANDRTWKNLRIFEITGPLHQSLVDVLNAYAMYRSDIGYVPGCNTIAALLLLNLPNAETAFIALANVLNRPLPLSFYTADETAQASAYNLVLQTLRYKSEPLYEHLTETMRDVTPELYLGGMFLSLFTGHLAIDEAARLWDVYVFEGDGLLVRAAVALLLLREMALLGSKTPDEVVVVMNRTNSSHGTARAVGEVGAEDRFMTTVRDAGKV
ncbi:Rab-GAP/TBC domain protein [Metarhizium album ARSEF 1941]|uniref:Rab-GAP/TBC domain protein n=1 Tax=Metarhizium album (strain ARSEF 1941) TaxID=1081103 RepID=A0A0B2X6Z8_METAS|nr:Rab-GAP/TBC domain protein [Metarhizium album ARSEF 1941]KHO01553.1 Rab-GAP/TBC domain protein [Metarhizium album ARSEF 1941]